MPRIGPHIYGAIVHDAAYRGVLDVFSTTRRDYPGDAKWLNRGVSREWADRAFLAIMVAANTGWLTRTMAFYAVRLFGRRAFKGDKA